MTMFPSRRLVLAGLGTMLIAASLDRPAPRRPDARPYAGPVPVPGGRLFVEDSGGQGIPIVLLHAMTGSSRSWATYQRPAFERAGLRVVSYSRRGFEGSPVEPGSPPGSAVDDLDAVVDALGIGRFHLLGTAAGGFIAPDYALSRPERLLSLTLACTQAGIVEPAYRAALDRMIPPAFKSMPAAFRELSPAFRALDPAGTAAWERIAERAPAAAQRINQPPRHRIDFAALGRIRTPTLVIAGAADLYIPPALVRQYAAYIPGARVEVLADCGHSAFWEAPERFNRLVLDFVARHR